MSDLALTRAIAAQQRPRLTPAALALVAAAAHPITHRVAAVHHDAPATDASRRKYVRQLHRGCPNNSKFI